MLRLGWVLILASGCATASNGDDGVSPGGDVSADASRDTAAGDAAPTDPCPPCVTDKDCTGGAVCAQFGGDIYCAPTCASTADCASDRSCAVVTSATGDQVNVCVPRSDVCGASVGPQPDASVPDDSGGPTESDASTASDTASAPDAVAPPPSTCGTLVPPATASTCSCDPKLHKCDPNGCYGGWWCDTATNKCHAPPTSCGAPDAGPVADGGGTTDAGSTDAGSVDAGPPGTVGPSGGTVSNLYFAVVGDTRPPVIDDTKSYPTAVIGKIYSDIAALSPMPPFVVNTGDYMFASATGTQAGPQLDMYLAARAKYPGMEFPALGNHECTGAVTSNCGPGTADGVTNNYSSFLSKMLSPIGKTTPWYAINIGATDKSWTAKFVFVAANAWTSTQQSWFDSAMAVPTTYTFVIRHEPAAASTAPGVSPSETIMKAHPYTLAIVGHTHTYGRTGTRQVTIGNGGAPLTGSANYGFGVFQRRASDGAIVVDMIDYTTGAKDPSFHFAVKADGSAAPP